MTSTTHQAINMRALDTAEIDTISGGETRLLYNIRVAGMQLVGAYNTETGHYSNWVAGGGSLVIRDGKV